MRCTRFILDKRMKIQMAFFYVQRDFQNTFTMLIDLEGDARCTQLLNLLIFSELSTQIKKITNVEEILQSPL